MSANREGLVLEAEAFGAAMRAGTTAALVERQLGELEAALRAAGLTELEADAGCVHDVVRLASARLGALLRRLGEGS